VPHTDRFKLPLAGTAAMVLASLPLAIPPANVAIFSQETSSSVGVRGASSNAQQFNLKSQGASTGLWRQELPYGSREAVGMVGLHLPEKVEMVGRRVLG